MKIMKWSETEWNYLNECGPILFGEVELAAFWKLSRQGNWTDAEVQFMAAFISCVISLMKEEIYWNELK